MQYKIVLTTRYKKLVDFLWKVDGCISSYLCDTSFAAEISTQCLDHCFHFAYCLPPVAIQAEDLALKFTFVEFGVESQSCPLPPCFRI